MSLDWPSAAFCSLPLLLSEGRPAWTRIWLCRQRIAARISSMFSAVGMTSVFVQVGTCATFAFLLAVLALPAGFLEPRATVALTVVSFFLVLASAGEAMRKPAATTATAIFLIGTARAPSRVGSVGGSVDPTRRPGTIPSVARLALGAPWLCAPPSRMVCPYREAEPLVAQ